MSDSKTVHKPVHIQDGPPSDVERIKKESNYLRGTLEETLSDPLSAGIPDDDNRLMKFHGSYLQDDRICVPNGSGRSLSLPINLWCGSVYPEELLHRSNGWLLMNWLTPTGIRRLN